MEEEKEYFSPGLGSLDVALGENNPVVSRVRAEYACFKIRRGRAKAALVELRLIRLGSEEAYGSDGVYSALALAYQGLAEMRLERREEASSHLTAVAEALEGTEWREKRHARLLATIGDSLPRLDGG